MKNHKRQAICENGKNLIRTEVGKHDRNFIR
jgi:hypothetical protein